MVHNRVHKSPPLVPILSRMNPVLFSAHYFPKIHSNTTSNLRPGLPSGLFPSGFPTTIFYAFLITPMRVTCSVHLILLDFSTL